LIDVGSEAPSAFRALWRSRKLTELWGEFLDLNSVTPGYAGNVYFTNSEDVTPSVLGTERHASPNRRAISDRTTAPSHPSMTQVRVSGVIVVRQPPRSE
jgi:hypothetical protein